MIIGIVYSSTIYVEAESPEEAMDKFEDLQLRLSNVDNDDFFVNGVESVFDAKTKNEIDGWRDRLREY